MHKQLMGALVSSTVLVLGCGAGSGAGDTAPADQETQSRSSGLDGHLAALGTAVLLCKGSVGPSDFLVNDENRLTRQFDTCPVRPEQLQEIDRLLALQQYARSAAGPYFVNAWTDFVGHDSLRACPRWELEGVSNAPRAGAVPPNAGAHETYYHWKVQGPVDCSGGTACATRRAVECATWLGERFIVSADPVTGSVTTDPNYWDDNTDYGNPDFFDFGWVHPMATSTGWPPGDLWGAPNRCGERCTFYHPNMIDILTGALYLINCGGSGGTWYCATECRLDSSPPDCSPLPL